MPIETLSSHTLNNQPYLCREETNLAIMQIVSTIITNPSYTSFKIKIKKQGPSITQHYVSNSPSTDRVFELLLNIKPIDTKFLNDKSFKLSKSVITIHQAYSSLGYSLDKPINPYFLYNSEYIATIQPAVEKFVYEVKSNSTLKNAISDREKRKILIDEIRKTNTSVMKKLFKKYQRFNLNVFTYVFNTEACISFREKTFFEGALVKQIQSMINKFHEKHELNLFTLFFCLQCDLSRNYSLTLYCATDYESEALSMKEFLDIKNDQYFSLAPHANIALIMNEVLYQMDIQGVDGINEKNWKVIFSSMLERYNYVYYESDIVSPKFIYKDC